MAPTSSKVSFSDNGGPLGSSFRNPRFIAVIGTAQFLAQYGSTDGAVAAAEIQLLAVVTDTRYDPAEDNSILKTLLEHSRGFTF